MRSTIGFPSPGGSAGELVETAKKSVVRSSMAQTSYHTLIVILALYARPYEEAKSESVSAHSSTAWPGDAVPAFAVPDWESQLHG